MDAFTFDNVLHTCFTPEQIRAIRATHVGIAGAGGLGSNCAVNLVRSGLPRLTIADFDVIDASNLNRQAYFSDQVGKLKVDCLKENLRRINPEVTVRTYAVRLDERSIRTIFDPCDIVIEAFDNPESKAAITRVFSRSGKLLVCASGLGGYGSSDRIVTRKIRDDFFVIGDGTSEVGPGLKPYAPCVAIAAGKQADVVLSWVLGRRSA